MGLVPEDGFDADSIARSLMDGSYFAKPKKAPPKQSGLDVPSIVDDELDKLGYPETSRLSILGNLGRENAWNPETIFGGHDDPKNNARNRGLMSWQGDRKAHLENFIATNGGDWTPNENNLRIQTRFLDNELRSKYPKIHNSLTDPGVDTPTASRQLRNYINYVPSAPYNTPDSEYDVKNNRIWAEKAKARGLGQFNANRVAQSVLDGSYFPKQEFDPNSVAESVLDGSYFNDAPTEAAPAPQVAPESPATIAAQAQSAADPNTPRAAVLLNPGETPNARDPQWKGFQAFETKDDHNRFVMVNLAAAKKLKLRSPQDIQTFITKNPRAFETLGVRVEQVDDTSGNQSQVVDAQDVVKQRLAANQPPPFARQLDPAYQEQMPEVTKPPSASDLITPTADVTIEDKPVVFVKSQQEHPDGTSTLTFSDGTTSRVRYQKNADGSLTPVEVKPPAVPAKTPGAIPHPAVAEKPPVAVPGATEDDYKAWLDYTKLEDSPASRQQFQTALAAAPEGRTEVTSAGVTNLQDEAKTDITPKAVEPIGVKTEKDILEKGLFKSVSVPADDKILGDTGERYLFTQGLKDVAAEVGGIDNAAIDRFVAEKGDQYLQKNPYSKEELAALKKAGHDSVKVNIPNKVANDLIKFAKGGEEITPDLKGKVEMESTQLKKETEAPNLKPVEYDFAKDDPETNLTSLPGPIAGGLTEAARGYIVPAAALFKLLNSLDINRRGQESVLDTKMANPGFDSSKPESDANPRFVNKYNIDRDLPTVTGNLAKSLSQTAGELQDAASQSGWFDKQTGVLDENGRLKYDPRTKQFTGQVSTETAPSKLIKMGVSLAGQAPRYAVASVVPGGMVTFMALDNMANTYVQGGSKTDIAKAGVIGGATGGVLRFAGPLAEAAVGETAGQALNSAVRPWVKPAIEIGVVGSGVGVVNGIAGMPSEENIKDIMLWTAMHALGVKRKPDGAPEKAFTTRFRDHEGNVVGAVEATPDGKVVTVDPTKEADIEAVLPAKISKVVAEKVIAPQAVAPAKDAAEGEMVGGDRYSALRATDQKDYIRRIDFLRGYLDLDKQYRNLSDKQMGVLSENMKASGQEMDRLEKAIALQVEQGAKHFGIKPDDFIGLVNEFEGDRSAIKQALAPRSTTKQTTLYYGADAPLTEVRPESRIGGVYLTKSHEYAKKFGEVVSEATADIKNPYDLTEQVENQPERETLIEAPQNFPKEIQSLRDKGYDAITYKDQVLVLDPSIVKLKPQAETTKWKPTGTKFYTKPERADYPPSFKGKDGTEYSISENVRKDGSIQVEAHKFGSRGKYTAVADFKKGENGLWQAGQEIYSQDRRNGVMTALYDYVAKTHGDIEPSKTGRSKQGEAFWDKNQGITPSVRIFKDIDALTDLPKERRQSELLSLKEKHGEDFERARFINGNMPEIIKRLESEGKLEKKC